MAKSPERKSLTAAEVLAELEKCMFVGIDTAKAGMNLEQQASKYPIYLTEESRRIVAARQDAIRESLHNLGFTVPPKKGGKQ